MKHQVTLVGAGNLAWQLAPALDNCGYPVRRVYSRNILNAKALTKKLYEAEATDSLDFSTDSSDIYILALRDDIIRLTAANLLLPTGSLLLHTSGTVSLETLGTLATHRTGVLYPLQSFSKLRKVEFREIPLLIEGSSPEVTDQLLRMGKALSSRVIQSPTEQRRKIHMAAIFANNFANFMFTSGIRLLQQEGLPQDILYPLIAETVNKLFEVGAYEAQTGPARRGDLRTLDIHLDLLKDHPEQARIYEIISQAILDTYASE